MESTCPARATDDLRGSGRLIVNADDFGLTSGINRGIVEAHEQGILTSASLMVRYPAAEEAAAYAKAHSRLSVGLHFDAQEWVCRAGEWQPLYRIIDTADSKAVRAELDRQLAAFEGLMGGRPTHLDSHQHIHLSEPARAVLLSRAEQMSIPLRSCTPEIRYCGSFYGKTGEGEPFPAGISITGLLETLRKLPAGWTELGCHPGFTGGLQSIYLDEREAEIRVLCSEAAFAAVEENDMKLCSFHDFRARQELTSDDALKR